MSRSCPYRREISDACNWHQDQALNSTIYILYQTGPTGFLLKEDGEAKNFKVFLGDVHNCTCSVFKKEKDLCKHICWVLLKKFRVLRTDPLSWQLGLNEREINAIIRGDTATAAEERAKIKTIPKKSNSSDTANPNEIEQRTITESDVCPICQDEFLSKKLPVSYCRYGCGNNVHIKCMKVWADHQKTNGETTLKCPLCREEFCSFELLEQEYRNNGLFKAEKQDLHYGIACKSCNSTPISGKCYKCTICNEFYLCQPCFNTDFHREHVFVFREKITQKFHKATRDHVGVVPFAVAQNLFNRELNEDDYDLLLQLDNRNPNGNTNGSCTTSNTFSQIPEKIIKSWPSEKVRENSQLLNPGYQCRICLRPFHLNQIVRKLPSCKHKFHMDCIDNWLLHSHPTCPIDGQVVWDPITAQLEKEEHKSKHIAHKNETLNKQNNNNNNNNGTNSRELTGLGLIINYKAYMLESKSKNFPIESSLLANKNELSGASKLNKSKGISKSMKLQRASSSDKPKSSLKIEVEGRNPSASILENLDDYTNSLARSNPLPENIDDLTKLAKQKVTKQHQHQKMIKNLKGPLPFIEVKGTKLDNQQNEDMIIGSVSNYSVLSRKQPDLHTTLTSLEHNSGGESSLRRNLVTIDQNNLNLIDVFNVSSMLNTKPYQLSRINAKKTNNDGKKLDFYLNDDDYELDNNFNNNFAQSHNSFTSNSYNYYTSLQKIPKKFDSNNNNETNSINYESNKNVREHNNNNDELNKIESVNYFDSVNNANSSSEKIIKNNNIVFPDGMLNGAKKQNQSNELSANKKTVKKLIHPPVKKPIRTNADYGAELIQANLPLVGVKTKLEENFRLSNQNYLMSNENLNDSTKS